MSASPPEAGPADQPAAPLPWWRRFGRRNWAYLGFVALLVPAALGLEAMGPRGPDSGGGLMAGVMIWALGSALFMLGNAVQLVIGLVRGRPVGRALIGLLLPPAIVLLVLASEGVMLRGEAGGDVRVAAAVRG
jgi:hypothetical protein